MLLKLLTYRVLEAPENQINKMLKFIKGHMETIDGISVFPVIAFLIFFIFFLGLFWYVFRMKRSHVEELSAMPLQEDPVHERQNN